MCVPQVQKEINQLAGKLDRVFTMTDELVYKDARKDEARRQAYKILAGLREVGVAYIVLYHTHTHTHTHAWHEHTHTHKH